MQFKKLHWTPELNNFLLDVMEQRQEEEEVSFKHQANLIKFFNGKNILMLLPRSQKCGYLFGWLC